MMGNYQNFAFVFANFFIAKTKIVSVSFFCRTNLVNSYTIIIINNHIKTIDHNK